MNGIVVSVARNTQRKRIQASFILCQRTTTFKTNSNPIDITRTASTRIRTMRNPYDFYGSCMMTLSRFHCAVWHRLGSVPLLTLCTWFCSLSCLAGGRACVPATPKELLHHPSDHSLPRQRREKTASLALPAARSRRLCHRWVVSG